MLPPHEIGLVIGLIIACLFLTTAIFFGLKYYIRLYSQVCAEDTEMAAQARVEELRRSESPGGGASAEAAERIKKRTEELKEYRRVAKELREATKASGGGGGNLGLLGAKELPR